MPTGRGQSRRWRLKPAHISRDARGAHGHGHGYAARRMRGADGRSGAALRRGAAAGSGPQLAASGGPQPERRGDQCIDCNEHLKGESPQPERHVW